MPEDSQKKSKTPSHPEHLPYYFPKKEGSEINPHPPKKPPAAALSPPRRQAGSGHIAASSRGLGTGIRFPTMTFSSFHGFGHFGLSNEVADISKKGIAKP